MCPNLGHRDGRGRKGIGGLNGLLAPLLLAFLPVPALAAMPDALTFQNGNVVVLSALACGGSNFAFGK